jgi:hypothetical protein
MRFHVVCLAAHERTKDRETGNRVAIENTHVYCVAVKGKRASHSDCMVQIMAALPRAWVIHAIVPHLALPLGVL